MRQQYLQQAEAANTDLGFDDSGLDASFDPRPDQQRFATSRQAAPHRLGLRANTATRLSAPELLDETGPFFDDSANQPTPKARKVAFLPSLLILMCH